MTDNADSDSWFLGTWLDKTETEDGAHLIQSIRALDTTEYLRARAALTDLSHMVTREAFVYVVANELDYSEYERSIVESVETEPLHVLQTQAIDYGRGLRYRFLNWLLSLKAFLDLTEAQLHRRYGKASREFARFKASTAAEYDAHFSYRFLYRLRNFAQHSAFPPLEGRIRGEVDDDTGEMHRWLELYLDKDKLLDQWSEWGSLGRELDSLDREIPVAPHMTSVMESITRIAAAVREIDLPVLRDAAGVVNALWAEATQAQRGSPLIGRVDPERPEELLSWHWLFEVHLGDRTEAEA